MVEDAETAPPTAMVAEARDGLLYVFMPPTEALEHFVDLIARVEIAAAKADCPVVIEGYDPPPDPRLKSTTITADPGVIEVNVAPSASFAEQRQLLETLYAEARLARLSTESFDVDGTHGGTGGGNHITLGGVTPADSPLLRRPDLLVSLLTYWQRHPSLSYLFAGRFVGTTSQAPRVDEGRAEALYELEIAFAEIARLASSSGVGPPPPWVTDRALRHLLTDITGNTHRAEFCIDKLYSPDGPRGRLGLLELRGFEMPPHLHMAMVQSLLVRSLVAWFWDEPLRAPLIRHGANLHGRYLLPHFLIHDIADVAADLRAHGIAFETSWLDPFTEFRFPRIGTAVFDGVEIELRGAIEPWNTLGEEATATGTARYVDSSVERIQVRIIGADRHRYVVTANGYPVPLLATDNPDIHVGGVRFRAWQPPSALHPTITHRRPAAVRARRPHQRNVTRRLHLPRRPSRRARLRRAARQRRRGRGAPRPAASRPPASPRASSTCPPCGRNRPGYPPTSARRASSTCDACVPCSSNGVCGHGVRRERIVGGYQPRRRALRRRPPAGRVPHRARPGGAVRPRGTARGIGYDEFVDRDGNVRAGLVGAGRRGRRARPGRARPAALGGARPDRQRRHHLHRRRPDATDDGLEPRPWSLDTLPIVVSAADWEVLEAGLVQRSRLLDAVLADLYGPRNMLTEGVLPPELLFAHPGYVRAANGIEVPGHHQLFMHACDLGRLPDGSFRSQRRLDAGPVRRRAMRWPTAASSPTRFPTSTSGSRRAPRRRSPRRCGWR